MNTCVVYFSRTGNTKKIAHAIAELTRAPIYDIAATLPSTIESFDLLIIGTPVEGASPTKEITEFVSNMNQVECKKAILFCTYRLFGNARTMNKLEKELTKRGYKIILKVSKKGMKPDRKTDLSDVLDEVKRVLEKQSK